MTGSLGKTKKDYANAMLKGMVGAVPIAGPVLAEIIGIVSSEREERIVKYVSVLEKRLSKAEINLLELTKKLGPERKALLEEATISAQLASSSERLETLATIAIYGISNDEAHAIFTRRMLKTFDLLDDQELLLADKMYCNERYDLVYSNIFKPERPGYLTQGKEYDAYQNPSELEQWFKANWPDESLLLSALSRLVSLNIIESSTPNDELIKKSKRSFFIAPLGISLVEFTYDLHKFENQ